jgi:hypothetical protein
MIKIDNLFLFVKAVYGGGGGVWGVSTVFSASFSMSFGSSCMTALWSLSDDELCEICKLIVQMCQLSNLKHCGSYQIWIDPYIYR